jgi:hypothetical protein
MQGAADIESLGPDTPPVRPGNVLQARLERLVFDAARFGATS